MKEQTKLCVCGFNLVARIKIDGGRAHDVDVSQHWGTFVAEGEDAVKRLVGDDKTICYFVRPEAPGSWTML